MAELLDLTAQCIRCGFCLESCPTFVVSGKETESPRGRIYLAKSMDEGVLPWASENRDPIDTCVGCRACETACPSGVKYGHILELTRARLLVQAPSRKDKWRLGMLRTMSSPFLLRLLIGLGQVLPDHRVPSWLTGLISDEPCEAELPRLPSSSDWPPLNDSDLPRIVGEVALLEGCAMDVLYPDVHEATERLLRRVGYRTIRVKGCCGALHAHAGYTSEANKMLERLMSQLPSDMVLVTNSAGCGCWLKESCAGGNPVFDATEFLFEHGLSDALNSSSGFLHHDLDKFPGTAPGTTVATVHDACHLAHGQKVREQPRRLLESIPGLKLVPLAESDMCCGSGGVYNLLQPGHARKMVERKWANIAATGASCVVTGNPGCHAWIAQVARENGGNVQVLHTLTVLESAFSGSLP